MKYCLDCRQTNYFKYSGTDHLRFILLTAMKRHNLFILWGSVISVAVIYFSFSFVSQPTSNILRNLLFRLETYYNWYPQQKIYVHTDKTNYDASETVWLKAYVLNATNHRPDSSSTNLYIDLIDPNGIIIQQKLLKLDKGFSNGDFSFKDTIPEGVYRIKAFSNLIYNTSPEFFFSKDIYISNPVFTTYATREKVKIVKHETKSNIRKSEKYDVSFFPEGGHLLTGVENKLGFKAINQLGAGIDVSGEIVDKNGERQVEFQSSHAGIGSFTFIPQQGIKYTALIKTPDGKVNKYKIPEAIDQGITLHCEFQAERKLKIVMQSFFPANKYPANTKYYLIAHSRGYPIYTAEFDLKDENPFVVIPTLALPSGILHFTLFNAFSNPVSERLVFINNQDELKINILPEKSTAVPHEKINLKVKVSDHQGNGVKGNFSLSIVESSGLSGSENIFINLLLNSDLKGKIENPEYYFTDLNVRKENDLDNLLLTQGWRRFKWEAVLQPDKKYMLNPQENYLSISGKITKEFFGIPLGDIPVTLSILNQYNDVFTTRSIYDGRFRFDGLEYYDTLSVRIEARRKSGRKNLVISLDVKSTERVKDMKYITNQQLRRPGPEGRFKKPVAVVSDDPFYEENTRINRIHSEPKDVIIVDDRFLGYSDVAQVIQARIPGVSVTGYKVVIRGVNSFYGSSDPLFLVDNIPVDASTALRLPPSEVERIEVIKGPEAAIYGSRGANGVIAIYTKRGKFMIKGMIEFGMLGYASPKEYYVPKYPYRADDPYLDDRRTILWVPYLITNSEGEATASFITSEVKGNFVISVEGINYKGIPGSGSENFIVR